MHIRLMATLATLTLAACATPPAPAPPAAPQEWRATLEGRGDFPNARASAHAVAAAGQTAIGINFAGGESGATHPWHVHSGTCGSGGGVVGSGQAYPPLRPGANGNAAATARIDVALQRGQNYHVNVHRSSSDMGTIISCGNLR
ncbi:MAG: hypothetical protein KY453_10660 [Gemmatimonadetes bacterium]|nr:hypothetical protein [Gemmatimonadota bacterium]